MNSHPSGLSSVMLMSFGDRFPSALATARVRILTIRSFSDWVKRNSSRFTMSSSIDVKMVSNSEKIFFLLYQAITKSSTVTIRIPDSYEYRTVKVSGHCPVLKWFSQVTWQISRIPDMLDHKQQAFSVHHLTTVHKFTIWIPD